MRKPIIAANWKMHKTRKETKNFMTIFRDLVKDVNDVDIVIIPPFTLIETAVIEKGDNIEIGAQNVHWEDKGAFTGEISADMLLELGTKWVVIGHSERRKYFGETDETVNMRLKKAVEKGLKPIVCVGETLEERESGKMFEVLERQVKGALANLTVAQLKDLVIAYEPVWAIGTGKNATVEDAQEAIGFIRKVVAQILGEEFANSLRIQYGGSVKPENISDYMKSSEIDGALVGGASLDPEKFAKIVKFNK